MGRRHADCEQPSHRGAAGKTRRETTESGTSGYAGQSSREGGRYVAPEDTSPRAVSRCRKSGSGGDKRCHRCGDPEPEWSPRVTVCLQSLPHDTPRWPGDRSHSHPAYLPLSSGKREDQPEFSRAPPWPTPASLGTGPASGPQPLDPFASSALWQLFALLFHSLKVTVPCRRLHWPPRQGFTSLRFSVPRRKKSQRPLGEQELHLGRPTLKE